MLGDAMPPRRGWALAAAAVVGLGRISVAEAIKSASDSQPGTANDAVLAASDAATGADDAVDGWPEQGEFVGNVGDWRDASGSLMRREHRAKDPPSEFLDETDDGPKKQPAKATGTYDYGPSWVPHGHSKGEWLAPASSAGLPVLAETPSWLVGDDALVVDGGAAGETRGAGGGILVVQPVFEELQQQWGDGEGKRPRWLRAALAANRAHMRRHKHTLVIRWAPTLEFPVPWLRCDSENCWHNAVRENFNWEKFQMMLEYLRSPANFSHVMVLDADAALVQPSRDVLAGMAEQLRANGKELLMASEDWLDKDGAAERLNGGMIFAKNTPFARNLFEDMLDARYAGQLGLPVSRIDGNKLGCTSNDQICLNAVAKRPAVKEKLLRQSGRLYNCGAGESFARHLGKPESNVEIMHFMGGRKPLAPVYLCEGPVDLTEDGPTGYGCAP